MTQTQMIQTRLLRIGRGMFGRFSHWYFVFLICFVFRASKFEFTEQKRNQSLPYGVPYLKSRNLLDCYPDLPSSSARLIALSIASMTAALKAWVSRVNRLSIEIPPGVLASLIKS